MHALSGLVAVYLWSLLIVRTRACGAGRIGALPVRIMPLAECNDLFTSCALGANRVRM